MATMAETDEELLARFTRGEAAAFEVLYRRHELRIWRYLNRNVGNRATADELMQEVWFAVAQGSARYQPTARFTTWLFTIAHHRLIDSLRAERRLTSLDALGYEAAPVAAQLTAPAGAGPVAALEEQDQAQALNDAVAALPPEQREAFLLQMEGELGVEDIAAIMQSSFETTKSRLRYARAKLRDLLRDHA
jgi:RNA polymerase sigma-70 factor (ECF subfamily)